MVPVNRMSTPALSCYESDRLTVESIFHGLTFDEARHLLSALASVERRKRFARSWHSTGRTPSNSS